MRIVITGATGFIGRHVLRALKTYGYDDLLVVGRNAPPSDARITFVETDLMRASFHDWLATHRPSHLLHLAWYAEHGNFWESRLNRDWREATVALARSFCEQGGKRIVVAGSCAEYDWSQDNYCTEGLTPLRPSTVYGEEKNRTREEVDEVCATHGVSLAWGRVFYPFGPGEAPARLIPSVVDALLGRYAPFPICLNYKRDLMPVEDVARAFVHLVHSTSSGVFNVCSGEPTKLNDLVTWIGLAIERDPQPLLVMGRDKGEGPHFLVGDNRALSSTGWEHQTNMTDRLQRYVRYLAGTEPVNYGMME